MILRIFNLFNVLLTIVMENQSLSSKKKQAYDREKS